jgi:hypothetical protein
VASTVVSDGKGEATFWYIALNPSSTVSHCVKIILNLVTMRIVLWIPMTLLSTLTKTFINNNAVTKEFRLTCSTSPSYSATDKLDNEVEAFCLLLLIDAALDSAFRFPLDA